MENKEITINVENPTKLDMLYMQRMTLQEQNRRIQAEAVVNQSSMQQIEQQIKEAEDATRAVEQPQIPVPTGQ